ncbi:PIN domain-like protein [Microstroma glucosiphilum]|uniref:PIN domain-like protein n=1 Tax=Pseudomicrostroma glucosiphilum TaxID=1684307 RepID=A0A316U3E9_9BASI|nr:PIN domain-like protein [Pseudomicrostroma glucosiphilum]PWN19777.1 PIN domain-like protein [Pseudomicrostroma glucosiphilum]
MRPSSLVFGIKGIFPLIKKECPQSIYYPHRFASLSGYRIAIDATLLVQRFHFSDDEHPARHLIGFHRLIAALRTANVYPIFVFDHLTSRISAKARETEKRREARGRVRARMRVELRRAWRLRVLNTSLGRIKELDEQEKGVVSNLLKLWRETERLKDPSEQAQVDTMMDDLAPIDSQGISDWDSFRIQLDQLSLPTKHSITRADDTSEGLLESILSGIKDASTQANSISRLDADVRQDLDEWQTMYEDQTSSAYAIAARIDDLRQDFQKLQQTQTDSIAPSQGVTTAPRHPHTAAQMKMDEVEEKLYNALAGGADIGSLEEPADLTWKMVEAKMDESIKEAQEADLDIEQSTRDEGDDAEATASQSSEVPTKVEEPPAQEARDQPLASLELIRERSRTLQRSYARSSSPLSSNVFDDCATLCALLQVPVLWTGSGSPYGGAKGEAEALAASLVTIGEADAVATEDSDVLLAEVPLIRHLTGTKKPMELVDSRAARIGLFPIKVVEPSLAVKKSRSPKSDEAEVEMRVDEQETERLAALSRADKLSRYAMLEFALLCGTDYNRTIPGLASRGALRLLREHQTIRGILKSGGAASKYKPPEGLDWKDYGAELSRARAVFRNPPDAKRALRIAGIKSSLPHDGEREASGLLPQAEEQKDVSTLQLPPRPPISLIDSLKQSLQAQLEGQINAGDMSGRRIFEIPDYDRHAVRSFLRTKGLGKGRSTSTLMDQHMPSSVSQAQAEESMMHELDLVLAVEEGAGHNDSTVFAASRPVSDGFGQAFGGEVAHASFGFDGERAAREQRTHPEPR